MGNMEYTAGPSSKPPAQAYSVIIVGKGKDGAPDKILAGPITVLANLGMNAVFKVAQQIEKVPDDVEVEILLSPF